MMRSLKRLTSSSSPPTESPHASSPTSSSSSSSSSAALSHLSSPSTTYCLVFMKASFGERAVDQSTRASQWCVQELGAKELISTRLYFHAHFDNEETMKAAQMRSKSASASAPASSSASSASSSSSPYRPAGSPCLQKNCGQERHNVNQRMKNAGLDSSSVRRWILAQKRWSYSDEVFRAASALSSSSTSSTSSSSAVAAVASGLSLEDLHRVIEKKQLELGVASLPTSLEAVRLQHEGGALQELAYPLSPALSTASSTVSSRHASLVKSEAGNLLPSAQSQSPFPPPPLFASSSCLNSASSASSSARVVSPSGSVSPPMDAFTANPLHSAVDSFHSSSPFALNASSHSPITPAPVSAIASAALPASSSLPASASPAIVPSKNALTNSTPPAAAAPSKKGLKVYVKSRAGQSWDPHKVNQDRAIACVPLRGHGVSSASVSTSSLLPASLPAINLYGVADGHGTFGHYVSEFIMHQLPAYLSASSPSSIRSSPSETIVSAMRSMCAELKRSSGVNLAYSGSTCVFALHIGDQLFVANVGDSRAVIGRRHRRSKRKNGFTASDKAAEEEIKCKPENDDMARRAPIDGQNVDEDEIEEYYEAIDVSHDHKPDVPIEKARILAAGGRVCPIPGVEAGPDRVWLSHADEPGLAMSRSIGDEVSATVGVIDEPEIIQHTLLNSKSSSTSSASTRDSFILLASDGVWEFISSQEAIDIIGRQVDAPIAAVNALVAESVKRWRDCDDSVIDDITVVLVFFAV